MRTQLTQPPTAPRPGSTQGRAQLQRRRRPFCQERILAADSVIQDGPWREWQHPMQYPELQVRVKERLDSCWRFDKKISGNSSAGWGRAEKQLHAMEWTSGVLLLQKLVVRDRFNSFATSQRGLYTSTHTCPPHVPNEEIRSPPGRTGLNPTQRWPRKSRPGLGKVLRAMRYS